MGRGVRRGACGDGCVQGKGLFMRRPANKHNRIDRHSANRWLGGLFARYSRTCGNPAWVQIDLKKTMHVGKVVIHHYSDDARRYVLALVWRLASTYTP